MRIIIMGAGGVGFHVARSLSQQGGHDIIVIDTDPDKVARIGQSLDVLAIQGEWTGVNKLQEAGIEKADMLIGVTSNDELNLLSCMIANRLGVKTKIARVHNPEYTRSDALVRTEDFSVDLIINPEYEAAKEIAQIVEYPYTFDVVEFENGRVLLIGIQIDENSPVLGKNLAEIADKFDEFTFRIVAINRAGSTIIPRGSESIKENDRLYVIAKGDKKDEVFKLAVEEVYANRNIMILGGGKIGQMVAERLDDIKHISVKMIESNEEKSEMLAGKLQNTLVVVGDGTDIDLLAQEGIQEHDMFIALTSNDETNIVSSLVAKHLRVKRTVTLIGREDYLPLTKTIGLDLAINARLIASNAILRFVRRGSVKTMCSLKGIEAEAFEFEISEKCKACDKTLKELSLPEGIIIGTILRKNEVIIPVGGTAIRPGDRAIVFCLPQLVGQVEKLFV